MDQAILPQETEFQQYIKKMLDDLGIGEGDDQNGEGRRQNQEWLIKFKRILADRDLTLLHRFQ